MSNMATTGMTRMRNNLFLITMKWKKKLVEKVNIGNKRMMNTTDNCLLLTGCWWGLFMAMMQTAACWALT